jgi:hypothetical protein
MFSIKRSTGLWGIVFAFVVLAGCTATPPPLPTPTPPPPVVTLVVNPRMTDVPAGETIALNAETSGQNLRFKWSAARGKLSAFDTPAVIYTAPDTPGVDTVTVEVNSSSGTTIEHASFNVIAPTPTPTPTATPTIVPTPPSLPKVVLKTFHNKFVTLIEGVLRGDADTKDEAEKFALLHVKDKIVLITSRGGYVTVTPTEPWRLKEEIPGPTPLENQQFTLIDKPKGKEATVAFLTAYGTYVTALNDEPDRHWELRATANGIQDWEIFTLVSPE